MVYGIARWLAFATLLATVLIGGFFYAVINTVCEDTGVDW